MPTTRIGKYTVELILDLERPFAAARKFFPDLTEDMLSTCCRELPAGQITNDGMLQMSFHAFVIKTDRHILVVDTCCGNDKERALRPNFHKLKTDFIPALAAANVRPEDVDFVMCTHLHWDHVGWNTRLVDGTWKPTFPNAKYIISKTEFSHWDMAYRNGLKNINTEAFADSVQPVVHANQVVLVEDDYELEKGVWLEPCKGHTPGNVVINVASEGNHGVISGDVIHHQIQLRFPSLSTAADDNRDLAHASRIALLEKHAGTGHLLLPAHFPAPSIGRIEVNSTGGFRYDTDLNQSKYKK